MTERIAGMTPRTLLDKLWDDHVVLAGTDGPDLLYVDLHLLHEMTSPQAFEGLRDAGRPVRRPDLTMATEDHNVPTFAANSPVTDPLSRLQIDLVGLKFMQKFQLIPLLNLSAGLPCPRVHPPGPQSSQLPASVVRSFPRVRLANIFEADTAVAAFHIGRLFFHMGGAYVFQAVCLGAALSAFDSGIV